MSCDMRGTTNIHSHMTTNIHSHMKGTTHTHSHTQTHTNSHTHTLTHARTLSHTQTDLGPDKRAIKPVKNRKSEGPEQPATNFQNSVPRYIF